MRFGHRKDGHGGIRAIMPGVIRRRPLCRGLGVVLLGCVVGCGRIGYDEISGAGGLSVAPDGAEPERGTAPEPDAYGEAPYDDATPEADADGGAGSESGVGSCDTQSPIGLYEWALALASTTDNVNFIVKLENRTLTPVGLESLTARYYFTNEIAMPWTLSVYYSDICCSVPNVRIDSHVIASYRAMSPVAGADSYLEFGFDATAGALAAGDSVQVELGFHATLFDRYLTQDNDYSFAPNGGTQAEWDRCPGGSCAKFNTCAITAYRDGVLVWGTPP
jgi:hypothetical protein